MKKQKAFTLVELLVVISIIALLMAILMPALTKIRQTAQSTVGKSNLRQWATFGNMYASDNGGSFPMGVLVKNRVAPGGQWVDVWREYFRDPKILYCPSATKNRWEPYSTHKGPGFQAGAYSAWGIYDKDNQATGSWPRSLGPGYKHAGSYGINNSCRNPDKITSDARPGDEDRWWRYMSMSNSEEVPFLFDCLNFDGGGSLNDEPPPVEDPFDPEYLDPTLFPIGNHPRGLKSICINRHSETINMVFVAGNVDSVHLKCLWTLRWNKRFRNRLLEEGKSGLPTEWNDPDHWMYSMKSCIPEYLQ